MSNNILIDSHAHVQFPAYDADRKEVLLRAKEAGVRIINVGTQYSTSLRALKLAKDHPGEMWATAGFHPGHMDINSHHDPLELPEKHQESFEAEKFLELAGYPEVVAIGECGLDYYRLGGRGEGVADSTKRQQLEVFSRQINIAETIQKPLVIHCRSAFPDLINIFEDRRLTIRSSGNGVIQFFSGTWDDARKLLNVGFFLGFGGVVTFARDYDETLKNAPLDRILLETDAPYVAPVPYRGKRNEPAYIVETAKKIAELRGIGYDEVAEYTTANAVRLFELS
jgi:TatD DNase family protein